MIQKHSEGSTPSDQHISHRSNDENALHDQSDDLPGVTIGLAPATIFRSLLCLVLCLAMIGAIANLIIFQFAPDPEHPIARLFRRLDLGHEPSLPAWYSSLALFASGMLLLVIFHYKRQNNDRFSQHWAGLAGLFFMMAIDEAIMIHEMVGNTLQKVLNTHGPLFFAWVIPALLLTGIIAVLYFKFLLHLELRTRWLFITAGLIFVGGAVGMEMVAGIIHDSYGLESVAHTIAQTIEETGEMLGVVIFIYALLDYIKRHIGSIQFQLNSPEGQPE